MMRFLLLLLISAVLFPITLTADEPNATRQAYRERMQARRAEALAERARINAAKPRAVYGRQTTLGMAGVGGHVEMVYSISQGRLVPSQYQRVAVPSRYGSGYYVTVARTNPVKDVSGSKGAPMKYQYGDQFKRNADGSITVYRNGIAIGKVGQQGRRGKNGKNGKN